MTGTGTQPPTAASYPGLPEERTPAGLAIAVIVVLVVPRIRLRPSVPVASRRVGSLAWRPRMRNR